MLQSAEIFPARLEAYGSRMRGRLEPMILSADLMIRRGLFWSCSVADPNHTVMEERDRQLLREVLLPDGLISRGPPQVSGRPEGPQQTQYCQESPSSSPQFNMRAAAPPTSSCVRLSGQKRERFSPADCLKLKSSSLLNVIREEELEARQVSKNRKGTSRPRHVIRSRSR